VSTRFDTSDEVARDEGLGAASVALQRGQLVVLPTDTVYGLAADAFDPSAVRRLLAAKGRGREMPPPVLVGAVTTLDALAVGVPAFARDLVAKYWPGPLTLVCRQQSSLQWDLGDARGTVAVRMPDDRLALDLLARTGPLAVSSANLSGSPAATTASEAEEMLGDSVEVYLDDGPVSAGVPSTIIDVTAKNLRILREGAISRAELEALATELGAVIDPADAAN
jgi:tRNA threonylcarbamoyl adenosine modification protein (Sua5/YciO/YrdC/YwlC family)